MGVQEMTRFGMKEKDFEELAGMVAGVLLRGEDVKAKAQALRARFLDMKYCFPEKEGKQLVAQLMHEIH